MCVFEVPLMPRWTSALLIVLLMTGVVVLAFTATTPGEPAAAAPPRDVPVMTEGPIEVVLGTRWSPVEGYNRSRKFAACLEEATGRPVQVLQRDSYAEANALVAAGKGDVAIVCSGATADPRLRQAMDAVWRLDVTGEGTYRSVLVVRESDPADSLLALRGASITWADPDSLTGYRGPRAALRRLGEDPDRFFAASSFSHSHDASIEAVSQGFVRVAAVDEHILHAHGTGGLRAVWTSEAYPAPPVLVRAGDQGMRAALDDIAGRPECLADLGASRLLATDWATYDTVIATIEEGR